MWNAEVGASAREKTPRGDTDKGPELAAVEGEVLLHAGRHRADGAWQTGEKRQPEEAWMLAQRLEDALDHLAVAEGLGPAQIEALSFGRGQIERRQSSGGQVIGMDRLAQPLAGAAQGKAMPAADEARRRGDIAIETATRQKLFDEYQSRLAATRSVVDRIRADLPVIERQLQDAERDAGRLREAQQAAERAFAAGNLDWNTYLTLSTSAVARRVEIEQLALAWSEQKSALQSLLGTELPTFPTPEPQR
jgi:hypothetical protein